MFGRISGSRHLCGALLLEYIRKKKLLTRLRLGSVRKNPSLLNLSKVAAVSRVLLAPLLLGKPAAFPHAKALGLEEDF